MSYVNIWHVHSYRVFSTPRIQSVRKEPGSRKDIKFADVHPMSEHVYQSISSQYSLVPVLWKIT